MKRIDIGSCFSILLILTAIAFGATWLTGCDKDNPENFIGVTYPPLPPVVVSTTTLPVPLPCVHDCKDKDDKPKGDK
jgi:hypothetical protein